MCSERAGREAQRVQACGHRGRGRGPARSGCLRIRGLGALVLLLAGLLPTSALAVSIPADVITLPAGDAATLDLSATPAQGEWKRLSRDLYFTVETTGAFDRGPATPTTDDPWIFDLSFEITFSGEVGVEAPPSETVEELLFTIQDMRLGMPTGANPFAGTTDLATSGFVRNSFAVDGTPVTPEIVLDDDGTITGMAEGFVGNCEPAQDGCNRWVGFSLPGEAGTHTVTMEWALGAPPAVDSPMFIFPNATFARVSVPEPGIAVLLGLGLAGRALRRRRRRA